MYLSTFSWVTGVFAPIMWVVRAGWFHADSNSGSVQFTVVY